MIATQTKKAYWISPSGDLIETDFENHAKAVAEIFKIKWEENKSIIYYRIAFHYGYVRVSINKDEMNVQLNKPATKKQIDSIYSLFLDCNKALITYGCIEGEVKNKLELTKALVGLNPYLKEAS